MVKRRLKSDSDVVLDNRPSFYHIVLQDCKNQNLKIPVLFSKQISKDLSDRATLKTPSCRSWSVKLIQTPNGLSITNGWHEFLKDNSLGHNEFLLFTYDGNMCFSVQIFDMSGCEIDYQHSIKTHVQSVSPKRKIPKGRTPPACTMHRLRQLKTSENCSGALSIESFDSKFPHFSSVIRKWTMTIPKSFSDAHLPPRKSGIILRNLKGKKWVVNSCPNLVGFHFLCGGWCDFRKDNKLKLNDVCIFELVGRLEMVVHTFQVGQRKNPKRRNCTCRPRKIPDHATHLPSSSTSKDFSGDFKEVESFNSQFPVFTKRIRANTVPIPTSISRVHLPNEKSKVVLRNSKGKEYIVNVISKSNGIRFLSGGWTGFKNANKIKEGDTCTFELIDKLKFQVCILRKDIGK